MIYLDSAATTLQKPKSVLQAMQRAAARYASPGADQVTRGAPP